MSASERSESEVIPSGSPIKNLSLAEGFFIVGGTHLSDRPDTAGCNKPLLVNLALGERIGAMSDKMNLSVVFFKLIQFIDR